MDKKSIICASLAAAILYTSAAIALEKQSHTAYASSVSIIYGDVDQNNTIDSFDALTTLRASAKITSLSALQTAIADVDGDEVITASDALDILRFSAGMRPSYHTGQSDNLDTPELDLDSRLPLTVDSDKENSSASSSSSTGTSSKETSSSNTSSKTTSSHTTSSNTHNSSDTTTSNTSSKTTSSHGSTSSNTSSKTTSSKATSSNNTSSKTTSSKVTSSQNTSSKTTSSNNTSSKVTSSQTTSSHNTSSTTSSHNTSSQTTSSQNTSSTGPQHTDTEEVVETTRTNCIAWVYCPICDTLIFDGVEGDTVFDYDEECYDHGGTLDDKFRFREPINGTPIYENDVMMVYECVDDRPAFQVKTQDGTTVNMGGGRTYHIYLNKNVNGGQMDTALALARGHCEVSHCYMEDANRWVDDEWLASRLRENWIKFGKAGEVEKANNCLALYNRVKHYNQGQIWYEDENGKVIIFIDPFECISVGGMDESEFPTMYEYNKHEEIWTDWYTYTVPTN